MLFLRPSTLATNLYIPLIFLPPPPTALPLSVTNECANERQNNTFNNNLKIRIKSEEIYFVCQDVIEIPNLWESIFLLSKYRSNFKCKSFLSHLFFMRSENFPPYTLLITKCLR